MANPIRTHINVTVDVGDLSGVGSTFATGGGTPVSFTYAVGDDPTELNPSELRELMFQLFNAHYTVANETIA